MSQQSYAKNKNVVPRFETLEQAQLWIRRNMEKGTMCPCCGQNVKVYRRKLNYAMVYGLILIYKYAMLNGVEQWLHVEDYLKNLSGIPSSIRGDINKLRFWELIEGAKGNRADGSPRNGYYRITPLGIDFVEGKILVPSHVVMYNNTVLRLEGRNTTAKEALGTKFNYNELITFK